MDKKINENTMSVHINKIKQDHGFKADYDLSNKILSLPTLITMHSNFVENWPRNSIIKKETIKIQKAAKKLIDALRDVSAQTKIHLDDMPGIISTEKGFDNLNIENKEWNINQFGLDLTILNRCAMFQNAYLQADTGGRKSNSLLKYSIFQIIGIYTSGTTKEPKCGWSDEANDYIGEFFVFLRALKPVLLVVLKDVLEDGDKVLSNDHTLGKYAVQQIKRYKKIVQQNKLDSQVLSTLSLNS